MTRMQKTINELKQAYISNEAASLSAEDVAELVKILRGYGVVEFEEKYFSKYWSCNDWAYYIIDEAGHNVRSTKDKREIEGLVEVMKKWDPALALHENNVHAVGEYYIPGPFIQRESVRRSVCNSVL